MEEDLNACPELRKELNIKSRSGTQLSCRINGLELNQFKKYLKRLSIRNIINGSTLNIKVKQLGVQSGYVYLTIKTIALKDKNNQTDPPQGFGRPYIKGNYVLYYDDGHLNVFNIQTNETYFIKFSQGFANYEGEVPSGVALNQMNNMNGTYFTYLNYNSGEKEIHLYDLSNSYNRNQVIIFRLAVHTK
jgi:hypothetical protein